MAYNKREAKYYLQKKNGLMGILLLSTTVDLQTGKEKRKGRKDEEREENTLSTFQSNGRRIPTRLPPLQPPPKRKRNGYSKRLRKNIHKH